MYITVKMLNLNLCNFQISEINILKQRLAY